MSLYTRLCSGFLFPVHERIKHHDSVRMRAELERTQWLSATEIERRQLLRLKDFLVQIGTHVPYYRRVFAEREFSPADMVSASEIRRLPFLTKALVRDNTDALRAVNARRLVRFNTGGSSGEPLVFFMGMDRITHDVAAKWRATRWWGVDIGDPEIVLWGSPIEIGGQDLVKALRDRLLRTRLLPAFQMSDQNMDDYLRIIGVGRPKMLFGYASALALLAARAKTRAVRFSESPPKVVFVTGETLYPDQRSIIEEVFRAPVANGYGARDAGFVAHECPAGSLHLSAEHIVVELLDESGMPVAHGDLGEIVITHLATAEFPFVRYRTGDMAAMSREKCACGRGLPSFERVFGRTTDFIRTRSGDVMHALALIYEVRGELGVRAFKFIQDEDMSIELQIVPGPELTPKGEHGIIERLGRRLGSDTPLVIRRVAEIPPEKSGKYRFVVSRAKTAA